MKRRLKLTVEPTLEEKAEIDYKTLELRELKLKLAFIESRQKAWPNLPNAVRLQNRRIQKV